MTTALVAILALAAGPALADPTQDELDRIAEQQATTGGTLGTFEVRFAAAQAKAEAAETSLSTAAENYDAAVIELAASRRAATAAYADAQQANVPVAAAQREVGRLAAQSYREGNLTSLAAFLADRRPEQVLDRATLLAAVGDHRQRAVRRLDAARDAATSLQRQADAAVARNRAAETRLAAARALAETGAAVARRDAAAAVAEQEQILVEVAAAQRTSIELERARLNGISEARARAELALLATADPSSLGGASAGSAEGGVASVAWARLQTGLPYQWGGAGPSTYDCSGLTMRAWERAGVALPHSSRAQYQLAGKVQLGALRVGDLLFYASDRSDPGTIHHVALYAGGGMMVEAPATGLNVRVVPMRYGGLMPYGGRP